MKKNIYTAIFIFLLYGNIFSQTPNTWTNLNAMPLPRPRDSHNMTWDSESQRAILYGGHSTIFPTDPFYYIETWAYNYGTNSWALMSPDSTPGARAEFAIAYNSQHDRVLFFGGNAAYWPGGIPGAMKNNDTWAYDFNNDNWTNLLPATSPDSLGICRMAYDSESDRVILHDNTTAKIWAFDYSANTWTDMNPPAPAPVSNWRQTTCIAYDSNHDRIIVATPLQETWAYDYNSNTWQQRAASPNVAVTGGALYDLEYDAANDKCILYSDSMLTYSYDYTTDTWTNLNSVPSPQAHHFAMTYAEQINRMLFYGGTVGNQAMTWQYFYAGPSGVQVEENKFSISISPNPFSIRTTITISSKLKILNAKLFIYDLPGREVMQFAIINPKTEIQRGSLQKGFYFYKLMSRKEELGDGKLAVE